MIQKSKLRGNPTVISMSVAGGYFSGMNNIITAAVEEGVIVTVAAGNSQSDACDFSPASARGAITVGAATIKDEASYFSNHGPCVSNTNPLRKKKHLHS